MHFLNLLIKIIYMISYHRPNLIPFGDLIRLNVKKWTKNMIVHGISKETNIFEFEEDILYPAGFKMHSGIIVF